MFHVVGVFSDAEERETLDMPKTGENGLFSEVINIKGII